MQHCLIKDILRLTVRFYALHRAHVHVAHEWQKQLETLVASDGAMKSVVARDFGDAQIGHRQQ